LLDHRRHDALISVTGAPARAFTLYIAMKIRGHSLVVCLGLLCVSASRGQQYTIQTLAGTPGTAGFVGDGGALSAAEFNSPGAVALDSQGNLYIADTVNHCIRKIAGGTITTIAGTGGTAGYSGDGAVATAAKLSSPGGLAFDSSGNLYIADTGNNVIRKISGSNITTVAGNQSQGPSYGGDFGLATVANLWSPTAIAFDPAGNYYIADNGNSRIRKVDTAGIITTYVGASGGASGTAGKLDHPNGLWFGAGALYIADSNHAAVARFVPPSDFTIVAGNNVAGFNGDGIPAKSAELNKPAGIAMDAAGNIYLADTNNSRIRKVTTGGLINTIAGRGGGAYSGDGGDATAAYLNFPRSVAVSPNGTVYIADTGNQVIRTLTPTFPAIGGVSNAASGAPRISPGALASVYGTGFGATPFTADDGRPWPTTTSNLVSVKVNGAAAPLYYVSPGQINFQVPWSTPTTGTVNVAVVVNGGSSNTAAVPVATAAPGLFYDQVSGDAIVQNTPSYSLNSASNPAPAGSTIVAYLTGSGPVAPAAKDGTPAPGDTLSWATSPYSATIGSATATVSFAGLTPGFIGLTQMNIVVPPTLGPGVYPLSVTIDGQTSNSGTIAVK
jgi:uncharacterized protein (TIGR03437 family)